MLSIGTDSGIVVIFAERENLQSVGLTRLVQRNSYNLLGLPVISVQFDDSKLLWMEPIDICSVHSSTIYVLENYSCF